MFEHSRFRPIAQDTRKALIDVAAKYGTPCFAYFSSVMRRQLHSLRAAFGNRLLICFAVKANPNIEILSWLRNKVDFLDISSEGELVRSLCAGWPADKLSFTGPGKTESELRAATRVGIGQLVLESLREAIVADRIAASRSGGHRQSCLIRIAPARIPAGLIGKSPNAPTPFGIPEEELADALPIMFSLKHLSIDGFHIYSGSHFLDAQVLLQNYEIFLEIFSRLSEAHSFTPRRLVLGAGLGIPYDEESTEVDLVELASGFNRQLDRFTAIPRFERSLVVYELGRFIAGPAGYYLSKVSWIKECRGTLYAILDGGMHHFQGASRHLAVLGRNPRIFKVNNLAERAVHRAYDLVGPLCTHNDKLAHGVHLPHLEEGDLLAIESAGGYGLTLSPTRFISHKEPPEILIEGDAPHQFRDISESKLSSGLRDKLGNPGQFQRR
jgi:diaminopimelate decarboxylase